MTCISTPKREDWARVIADLEAIGLTVYTIAKMTQCDYTQVKRWKTGREPKYLDGARLLAIHAEYVIKRVSHET